jgi:hypothetical protein
MTDLLSSSQLAVEAVENLLLKLPKAPIFYSTLIFFFFKTLHEFDLCAFPNNGSTVFFDCKLGSI